VNSGAFTMEGGAITNNKADYGGGVYVGGGVFTMEGGAITGNTASLDGGGVCVSDNGAFNITGGTISGNTASDGGGVFVYGTFSVGGSPVVTGNTKKSYGTANNVYLSSGKAITLSGELSGGASLGVTMKDSTGVFTSGWAAQMDTASPADFFISDNSAYAAHLGTGGEAELGQAYAVSVTDGIAHGTVTADRASACAGDTVTLTVTADSGYELDTLNVMQGETAVDVTNNRFTMPAGDVTVSATFKETATEPEFTVHSLLLSGEIGVNFFMDLPEIGGVDYSTSYMEFVVSGKDGKTTTDPYDATHKSQSGKYYGFTCYVNSIQMADEITATFHYTQGGENKTVSHTYSVKDYLDTIATGNYSAEMKALGVAIGNYGYYAQTYLSGLHGFSLGTDHASMPSGTGYSDADFTAAKTGTGSYAIVRDTGDSGIEKVSYSLVLDSSTGIYLYLKPASDYTGDVTAVIGNGTENVAVKQSDGRYRIHISGISAHMLADMYTVTVTAGTNFEIRVSALSYVDTMLKSESTGDALKKMVVSLYQYYDNAIAYRNSIQ